MTETAYTVTADEPGIYGDEDFAVLAGEVENLAAVLGELVKVVQHQSQLLGILLDVTGVSR